MANYKVTLAFQTTNAGPTESYISKDLTTGQDKVAFFQGLMDKRNLLMGDDVDWAGIRVTELPPEANLPAVRSANFYPPGTAKIAGADNPIIIPEKGKNALADKPEYKSDQVRSCVQIRVRFSGGRAVTRYLAPVPDLVVTGNPDKFFPGAIAGFVQNFDAFLAFIVANCKIRGLNTLQNPQVKILEWMQPLGPPRGNMGPMLLSATAPTIAQGDIVRISNVRRKGTDRLSYNGRYYVASLDTEAVSGNTIYYLRQTKDGDVTTIKKQGTIQRIKYGYLDITEAVAVRCGVHKRGNGLGRLRGRRQSRLSLDP